MKEVELSSQERKILAAVDHTLLSQTATWEQTKELLREAEAFHVASACIAPTYVARAADFLAGRLPVCTVVGFPNGYSTCRTKVFEAE